VSTDQRLKGVVLGFSAIPPRTIATGVQALAALMKQMRAERGN